LLASISLGEPIGEALVVLARRMMAETIRAERFMASLIETFGA
jgi:hypothetical protein